MNSKKTKQHSSIPEHQERPHLNFGFFDFLAKLAAWFFIVISIIGLGAAIGFIISFFLPDQAARIVLIVMIAAGIVGGIIYATYIWKSKGTYNFLSTRSRLYDIWKRRDY